MSDRDSGDEVIYKRREEEIREIRKRKSSSSFFAVEIMAFTMPRKTS